MKHTGKLKLLLLSGLVGLSVAVANAQFTPGKPITAADLNTEFAKKMDKGAVIDATPIGQVTPAAGSFTTLKASQFYIPSLQAASDGSNTSLSLVPSGNGALNTVLTNSATLGIYSDTAKEIVLDAYTTGSPTSKYTLALAKYGGNVTVGGVDDGTNKFQVYGSSKITGNLIVTGNLTLGGSASVPATGIMYTQTGTGAAQRSVDSKLKDTVSILDFPGCDRTGTSDSTTCIQAALNSGATSVYVPAGRYKEGGLVLPQVVGFTLFGDGANSVLVQTGASIRYPKIASAATFDSHATIRDLSFDGTAGTGNTVDTTYAQTLDLLNLSFNNVPANYASLKLDGNPDTSTYMHDVRVKNIRIYSTTAGKAGIELGAFTSDSTIDGFIMNGGFVVQYGLLADIGAQTTMVSNSHPYNASKNVVLLSGNNNDFGFTGNTIDNALNDVFVIRGSSRTRLNGNWIESINSHYSGLVLDNAFNNNIHNLACQTAGITNAVSCVSEINGSGSNAVTLAEVDAVTNYSAPFSITGTGSYYNASNAGNTLNVKGAAAGGSPSLAAAGTDGTIPVVLAPKGNGAVNLNLASGSGVATGSLYTDTAGEVTLEAYNTATPATKYNLNLGKYGGRILMGNVTDDLSSKLQVGGAGIFTGNILAGGGSTTVNDGTGSSKSQFVLQRQGVTAWGLSNASGASNQFGIDRYVNGTFQDSPISIDNAAGNVAIAHNLAVSGNTTFNGSVTFSDPTSLTNSLAYNSGATGAVSRTLTSKLSDSVNAADYGATCNGTTDTTPAITAAEAALGSAGGVINLPRGGKCLIDTALTLNPNVTLKGSYAFVGTPGDNTSAPYGNLGALIVNPNVTVTLKSGAGLTGTLVYRKGMVFPAADDSAFAGTAITLAGDDTTVDHVMVMGFNKAVYGTGVQRPTIDHLYGDNINGIELTQVFDIPRITNNHMWPFATVSTTDATKNHRAGDAYYLHDSVDGPILSNNFSYGYLNGYHFKNISTIHATNNMADGTTQYTGSNGWLFEGNINGYTGTGNSTWSQTNGVQVNVNGGQTIDLSKMTFNTNTTQVALQSGNVKARDSEFFNSTTLMTVANANSIVDLNANTLANNTNNVVAAVATSNVYVGTDNVNLTAAAGTSMTTNNVTSRPLASGDPLALPPYGDTFTVSGNTSFGTLQGGWAGRKVTLVFQNPLTVFSSTNAGNGMYLTGGDNYKSVANGTLTLVHNGTQWVQTSAQGDTSNLVNNLSYNQGGTGAVARSVSNKLGDTVNIKDFGVLCNGTDETTTITAAFSYAQTNHLGLSLPSGANNVCGVTATLNVTSAMALVSNAGITARPILKMLNGTNAPLIKATAPLTVDNVDLQGSATSSTPLQALLYVSGTNNVELKRSTLTNGYDLVKYDGTSFYNSINDVLFSTAVHSQLYVNSTTDPGVDLIMTHVRALGLASTAQYAFYFNGLGSIIASDVQMSVNDPTSGSMYFDQPAKLYGGAQFSNVVIENGNTTTAPALTFNGTSAAPWHSFMLNNSLVTGNNGPAIQANFIDQLRVSNTEISSIYSKGSVYFPPNAYLRDLMFSNVDFEGTGTVTPVQADTGSTISGTMQNPRWGGTSSLIDLSKATVPYWNNLGGNPGFAANPITVPSQQGILQTNGQMTLSNNRASSQTLTLSNTNTGGASMRMIGDGSTTPSKTLAVNQGKFGIYSDNLGTQLMGLDDSGNVNFAGGLVANGQGNLTTSGAMYTLGLTDTGANGANLKLLGNGSTTPNKFIRANSGAFQVVNSAYTAPIFTLNDTGAATFGDPVTTTNNLQYNQGSTGAVNRALGGKLGEQVDVRDFGALCNSTHDDTSAIQAAINYLQSTTYGGQLNYPAGQCLISSTLSITKPNIRQKGKGMSQTLIVTTGDFNDMVIGSNPITPMQGDSVEDIGFYHAGSTPKTSPQLTLINGLQMTVRASFSSAAYGLVVYGGQGITLDHIVAPGHYDPTTNAAYNSNQGITLAAASTLPGYTLGTGAVDLPTEVNLHDIYLNGPRMKGWQYGVAIFAGEHISFSGDYYVGQSTVNNIHIEQDANNKLILETKLEKGGYIDAAGGAAIWIGGPNANGSQYIGSTTIDADVKGQGGDGQKGIYIDGTVRAGAFPQAVLNTKIGGNVSGFSGNGVELSGGTNTSLTGAKIWGNSFLAVNQGYGLLVGPNASYVNVSGGQIGGGTYGIGTGNQTAGVAIDAAARNVTLTGVDLRGNQTAASWTPDTATSGNRIVASPGYTGASYIPGVDFGTQAYVNGLNAIKFTTPSTVYNPAIFVGPHAGDAYPSANPWAIGIGAYAAPKLNQAQAEVTCLGTLSCLNLVDGNYNVAVGLHSFGADQHASNVTVVGNDIARNSIGGNNYTGVGSNAIRNGNTDQSVGIGAGAIRGNASSIVISGTPKAGDTLSFAMSCTAAGTCDNSPQTYTYTVASGDTLQSIAVGIANLINANPLGEVGRYVVLQAGVPQVTTNDAVVRLDFTGSSTTGWKLQITPTLSSGATETVAINGGITATSSIAIGTFAVDAAEATSITNSNFVGTAIAPNLTNVTAVNCFGNNTCQNLADGNGVTAMGDSALQGNKHGQFTTAFGYGAGQLATGSTNTWIGSNAGAGATTGSGNTVIGTYVNDTTSKNCITTGNSNFQAGQGACVPSPTSDGQMSIMNIIYGLYNAGTGTTVSAGRIGIGQPAPTARFEVKGIDALGTTPLFRLVDSSGNTLFNVNDNGGFTTNNQSSITTSGANATLILTDTGGNGANLKLVGNGSTTPSKTIRENGGSLQILNDAYTKALFSMDDSGNTTHTGTLKVTGPDASGSTNVLQATDNTGKILFNTSDSGITTMVGAAYLTNTSTGGGGAAMTLTGDGTTTPAKTIAVTGGTFGIYNNARSALLFGLDDAGNSTFTNTINLTGSLFATTTSSTQGIRIWDTGANGANLRLHGNGSTTPDKYIRSQAGRLEVVNSGYTNVVAWIDDNGNIGTQYGFYGQSANLSYVKFAPIPVASLPACGSSLQGTTYAVTDATTPTWNTTLTGGGTASVMAYCDGTSWKAH